MNGNQKLDEVDLRSIVRGEYSNFAGRTFDSKSKFNREMSSILGRFFKRLRKIDTDTCLPYFIFNLDYDENIALYAMEYVGVRYETEGISLVDTRQRFQQAQEQFRDDLEKMRRLMARFDKCIKYVKKRKAKYGTGQELMQRLKDKKDVLKEEFKQLREHEKNTTVDYGLIGYDTEYQIAELTDEQREMLRRIGKDEATEKVFESEIINEIKKGEASENNKKFPKRPMQLKRLLSHQFCIDVHGKRLAFVICTEERFTDDWFLDFLGSLAEHLSLFDKNDNKFIPNKYYIFAHFSISEASWLDNSNMERIRQRHQEKELWKNKRKIYRTGKKWHQETCIVEKVRTTSKKGGKTLKGPVYSRIHLHFADTMDLYPASLRVAAEGCGFIKKELGEGTIENMAEFKQTNFEDFCRYGCVDSVVTSAIALDIHSRFSALYLPFQTRVASYSEKYFKRFYEENYADYGDWRELLGQVYGYQEGQKYQSWMPNKLQRDVLEKWYHGGRNEVKRVGCFGEAFYHDLVSAYPSAAIMMHKDFEFSRSKHYWGKDACIEIERLHEIGPFQPHGVAVFCRFKEDSIPIFPAHVSGAITFPRIFHGVATWPEFWVAQELELLEECTIIELSVFQPLPGRKLPLDMKRLLAKRKENKLLFKNLLNYNYGKQIQGVSGDVPFSSITCPALGAYFTGFCRAAVGELANLNKDYFAITTDGFISPRRKLETGKFNDFVSEELKTIGYKWIGLDAHATKSFFIKTRGYGLWNGLKQKMKRDDAGSLIPIEVVGKKEPHVKQAKMGIQAVTIKEFMNQINAGRGNKKVIPGFSNLEPGEIATMSESEFTINTTFDMKHIPLPHTIATTELTIDGVTLKLTSFETRPINDVYEYQNLRELAATANNKKFQLCQKKGLNEKEISDLLTAHILNEPINRQLMWEFRKRLAHKAQNEETSWTAAQQDGLRKLELYSIHLAKGLSEYLWLLKNEAKVILDHTIRKRICKEIVEEMEEVMIRKILQERSCSERKIDFNN